MSHQQADVSLSRQVNPGRDPKIPSLFAAKDRQVSGEPKGSGAGVGLLLHRSVDPMQTMTSAIDEMLVEMATEGFVRPAEQSEVASILSEIRRTGRLQCIPWEKQARMPVTCVVSNVGESSVAGDRR